LLAVTRHRLWPAFVVIAIQTALKQLNDPASFALVPRVVSPTQLVQANAANATSSSLARLVGSPLGGIAVAFGGLTTVVVVDAVTFGAVAVATSFVRTPTPSLTPHTDQSDKRSTGLGAGVRALRHQPGVGGYIAVQALAQLTFAMFPVLFIVFVVNELHGGGTQIGVIRGMAALGGITASLLVARRAKHISPTKLMAWGYVGLGAVAAVFINAPTITRALWVYLVLFALTGLPNVTSQIGARSTAQQICPPDTLGRLSGIMSATGALGAAIGSIGTGLVIDHIDVRTLFNAQAALYAACGIATYFAVIRPRRHIEPSAPEPAIGAPN
jgi:predicted MFS family arabinose efflux permease